MTHTTPLPLPRWYSRRYPISMRALSTHDTALPPFLGPLGCVICCRMVFAETLNKQHPEK